MAATVAAASGRWEPRFLQQSLCAVLFINYINYAVILLWGVAALAVTSRGVMYGALGLVGRVVAG